MSYLSVPMFERPNFDTWDDESDEEDDIYDYERGTCPHNNLYLKDPRYIYCRKCYEKQKRKKERYENFNYDNFTNSNYKSDASFCKPCGEDTINSHFKTLGIKPTKDKKKIRRAFLKLSKIHHPDKGGSDIEFRKIYNAYHILYEESMSR